MKWNEEKNKIVKTEKPNFLKTKLFKMSDILNKLQNISSDEQKIRINLRPLQEEVGNQYELLEKKKLEKKALDNYLDSTPSS